MNKARAEGMSLLVISARLLVDSLGVDTQQFDKLD